MIFRVPSFKGFQQHDSHELLRNLLDTVKTEELKVNLIFYRIIFYIKFNFQLKNKRRQTVILEHFEVSKSINHLTDLDKKKIKRYGRLSSYTLIDKLFGGHLLSTIVCDECKNCLQRVEPFLDLSLPIVDESNKSIVSIASAAASTTFSLTSSKLKNLSNKKLAKNHHEQKANIDQYLKDEDEKLITKNQAKKQKRLAKKSKVFYLYYFI
jgi:ubiquitin carboxyl-terminal hydrolase 16/45